MRKMWLKLARKIDPVLIDKAYAKGYPDGIVNMIGHIANLFWFLGGDNH